MAPAAPPPPPSVRGAVLAEPQPPRVARRGLWALVMVHAISLGLSLMLHLSVAGPVVAWKQLMQPLDTAGDLGPDDGPVGNDGGELLAPGVPVNVSIYQAPAAPTAAPTAASAAAPTSTTSAAPKASQGAASAASTSADGTATQGDGTGGDDGLSQFIAGPRKLREGISGKPPRGKRKRCEAIDEVKKVSDTTWRVERSLLDWYATHLRELERQAGVSTHRDDQGKRDGARLYLPRCSLLKQGGFRNGDVINSVNGRKVNTIPQGVATWLAVRGKGTLTIELTRKNGDKLTHKIRLQ